MLLFADGMGGHAVGEVASNLTLEGIVQSLYDLGQEASKQEGDAFESFLEKSSKT